VYIRSEFAHISVIFCIHQTLSEILWDGYSQTVCSSTILILGKPLSPQISPKNLKINKKLIALQENGMGQFGVRTGIL
jgi:hypothetical protein